MSKGEKIQLLVIDVDGTMTDAGIYYDQNGNELKKFCTKDAAGFFAAKKSGIEIMVLTGRECAATQRRMEELKVDYLYQNVRNKKEFLTEFIEKHHLNGENIGYIGDDLNDLAPMQLCGFIACPCNSCQEIKNIADYVSPVKGGEGAVRDIIEHFLNEAGIWEKLITEIYDVGR
ncbi:HAD-IIIA family hydrolase [Roseburia sp. NSJ-9]|uniref:HAD-IIIA family hydrolase n=2 Tax=Roseburia TaxID=841 RepID=A0ABR7GHN0_9FIRM|nr:HAD-IIIA family hydrolase [Roseburia lenta]MBC5686676.1 HAD-IIIA family hydrolase [Roseburia lenta]